MSESSVLGPQAHFQLLKCAAMRELYPSVEPFDSGRLAVSDLHTIYYEQAGNPKGKPVVVLHGGPGGGVEPTQRRFFDPAAYRIILFDQRGCGQSTPHAELRENTTWHLVDDIERIRTHLSIDRWQVFGGSWGSALALAYAQSYPARVTELVLRGIFLIRPSELLWLYQHGTNAIFPDAWENFIAPIPMRERDDFMKAYYARLTGEDEDVKLACARAWSQWEAATVSLYPAPDRVAKFADAKFALAFARIECHYFHHGGWLTEGQLLRGAGRLASIPGVIVNGRYDVVTPMTSAWALHRAWPEADLRIVADAGHTASEPGIVHELVSATDRFRA